MLVVCGCERDADVQDSADLQVRGCSVTAGTVYVEAVQCGHGVGSVVEMLQMLSWNHYERNIISAST